MKTVSILPANGCVLIIDNIESITEVETFKKMLQSNPELKLLFSLDVDTKSVVSTKTNLCYPSTFKVSAIKKRIDEE